MNREYCDPAGKFMALVVALTGLWSEISWASGVEVHLKLKLGGGVGVRSRDKAAVEKLKLCVSG